MYIYMFRGYIIHFLRPSLSLSLSLCLSLSLPRSLPPSLPPSLPLSLILTQVPEDVLSIQTILIILFVDTLLYMTLVWYIEGVWPGKYGVRKPVYFPLLPSYWLGRRGGRVCVGRRGRGGGGKVRGLCGVCFNSPLFTPSHFTLTMYTTCQIIEPVTFACCPFILHCGISHWADI